MPCDDRGTVPILAVARCGRPLLMYCWHRTGRTVPPFASASMLRLISVSCIVAGGCSTVLPVSIALLACAGMAEILKAGGAADWPA